MTQSANNRFVEIGRIGRPHGLDGKVRFLPNSEFTDDLLNSVSVFYVRNVRSDLIPIRIESVHVENKKNQQSFFVKFDMIANRDQAEESKDKAVFIDKDHLIDNSGNDNFDDEPSLDGYSVWFNNREIGHVLDILENPAHPILEIKLGPGSLLIPFVDEFVERVDHENGDIHCTNLDQLTDL